MNINTCALGAVLLCAAMPAAADQTGLYAGLLFGSAGGGTEIDRTSGGTFKLNSGAPAFGLLLGYELHAPDQGRAGWRYGVEGDLSYAKLDRARTDASLGRVRLKQTYAATLRGRAGYDFGRFYLYGTGGIHLSDSRVSTNGASLKQAKNTVGVLGAGLESEIGNNWNLRTELLGTTAPKFTPNGGGGSARKGSAVFRLGLTRKW